MPVRADYARIILTFTIISMVVGAAIGQMETVAGGHRVLASAPLLDRIDMLPGRIAARSLGPISLRGKEVAPELYALEAAGTGAPGPSCDDASPKVTSAA